MINQNLTDQCRAIIKEHNCHTVPTYVVMNLLETIDLMNKSIELKDERIKVLNERIDMLIGNSDYIGGY